MTVQQTMQRHRQNGCAVISATSHLGDSQVGDKPTRRQPTRRHESVNSATTYLLPFIIYFRVIRYRHIHFGTSVVQRYHKFCDPIHSSLYMVRAATHLPDAICLKRLKMERKLLLTAYIKSCTSFQLPPSTKLMALKDL